MYRFVLRPGWIATHVLVLAVIVLFVNLGLWQLDRHRERAARNDRIEAQLAAPPAPLDDVLAEGGDPEYRQVTVTGTYRPAEETLLSPRSREGQAGHHLLTPLVTSEGRVLVVDRGWVPVQMDDPPVAGAAAPDGQVTVSGWLQRTAPASRAGPVDQAQKTFMSSVDPAILAAQVQGPLIDDVYLVREDPAAVRAAGDLPRPGLRPDLDAGPHLGYAGQWVAFAGVVAIGYPFLLRRQAADRQPVPAQ